MNTILLLIKVTLLLAAALLLVRMLARSNPRWRMLVCEGAAVGLLLLPLVSMGPLNLELPFAMGASVEERSPVGQPTVPVSTGPGSESSSEPVMAPVLAELNGSGSAIPEL